ncbi:Polyamine aminopropyltransferase [subsurface metagenome]|nr:hypothetical protein [Dehalococcoidia bacterium]
MPNWRIIRRILIGLFLLSGSAALLYQLAWVRLLAEVFGNSVYAISTVLACFMGGLALGSWLMGIYTRWQSQPVRWYIIIEAGIGFSAVVATFLMGHIDRFYQQIYLTLEQNLFALTLIRFLMAAPLLLLPTTLMGATLPVLSRIVFRYEREIGRDFSDLYGFNTLGASLGALAAGFFLFEFVGVTATVIMAVVINLLIAMVVILLRKAITRPEEIPASSSMGSHDQECRKERSKSLNIALLAVLFLNGFAALGLEVFWSRLFAHFIGNSTYAFTLILVTHLVGIALGSWLIGRFADRIQHPARVLVGLQLTTAISLLLAVLSFGGVFRTLMLTTSQSWPMFLFSSIAKAVIILLPPALLMGTIFPLLNRTLIRRLQGAGPQIGRLYALNTVGAILGSLLSGFILIRLIGVSACIVGSAALYALAALMIAGVVEGSLVRRVSLCASGIALVGMLALAFMANGLQLTTRQELAAKEVVYYREGTTATVKVYRSADENQGLVLTANGSMIGADNRGIMRKQAMLANLAMLMLSEPRSAFVVGLGTGVTLGEFLKYPLDRVVCAEISQSVVEASHHFAHVNGLNYDDPRLHWVVDDGKSWLASAHEKFDVISSDAMLRRGSSGNGRLYSLEYYRLCLNHLSDSGVFIQWAPAYLTPEIHKMIVRTFTSVFPYVSGWYIGSETLILMGTKNPLVITPSNIRERMLDPKIGEVLVRIDFPTWQSVLSTLVFNKSSLESYTGSGPLNTLDVPSVEFKSPRNFTGDANVARFLRTVIPTMISPTEAAPDVQVRSLSQVNRARLDSSIQAYRLVMQAIAARIAYGEIEGKRFLCQALTIDPTNSHALHYLGLSPHMPETYLKSKFYFDAAVIMKEMGAWDFVFDFLDSSLAIAPTNLLAHNRYYLWLMERGELDAAVRAAERALLAFPDHPQLLQDLKFLRSERDRQ